MSRKQGSTLRQLEKLLEEARPLSSRSLLVTLFGDAIIPRGGSLWMSELIALAAPFGLSERLVRTSVFRLTEEGWLSASREGRTSRYSLTDSGAQRFAHAFRRIYEPPAGDWDGNWTLLVLTREAFETADRKALRSELEWEGFGQIAAGVFAHPTADHAVVAEILSRHGLGESVIAFSARDISGFARLGASKTASECWRLVDVAQQYRQFITQFSPLAATIGADPDLSPEQAFLARTLLIHTFRRVSLHDPRLPAEMLPVAWPGERAYDISGTLYRSLLKPSETHIDAILNSDAAKVPQLIALLKKRFRQKN